MRRWPIALVLVIGCGGGYSVSPDDAGTDGGLDGSHDLDGGGDAPTDGADAACGADLQIDPKNCGRCGHDCLGGHCGAGKCDPITLASGEASPYQLALDATTVYWTNYLATGSVQSCLKSGCTTTSTTVASALPSPTALGSDGTSIYWNETGSGTTKVSKCIPTACGIAQRTTLLSQSGGPIYGLSVGASAFYWGPGSTGSAVESCSTVTGCGSTPVLVTASLPFGAYNVVFANGRLVWSGADGSVSWCDATSCVPTPIAAGQGTIVGLAVAGDKAVWATGGGTPHLRTCTIVGCNTPTTLGDGPIARSVTVDATDVYFTSSDGTVRTCPLTGCPATGAVILVSGETNPGGIVWDETSIYWGSSGTGVGDGRVMRLAK